MSHCNTPSLKTRHSYNTVNIMTTDNKMSRGNSNHGIAQAIMEYFSTRWVDVFHGNPGHIWCDRIFFVPRNNVTQLKDLSSLYNSPGFQAVGDIAINMWKCMQVVNMLDVLMMNICLSWHITGFYNLNSNSIFSCSCFPDKHHEILS